MDTTVRNNKAIEWAVFISSLIFSITYVFLYCISSAEFDVWVSRIAVIAVFVLAIVTIILVLTAHKINKVYDPAGERINTVGSRFVLFSVLISIVPLIFELIGSMLIPDFYDLVQEQPARFSFAMTVLTIYVIALPALYLTSRKVPKLTIRPQKMGFRVFAACVSMVAGLALAGTLIGLPIHTVLTDPFSTEETIDISRILLSSTLFERILVMGIMAPIFEELIFRKILIDRTIQYGQVLSILLSGIMFGLFHGNFQQFFFATLIGMLFALVYIRTGRIRYTIFLHMCVNLSTSIITATLVTKVSPYLEKGSEDMPQEISLILLMLMAWIMFLLAVSVTGIILLIVFRKRLTPYIAPDEPKASKTFGRIMKSPLFWSFAVLNLAHFGTTYLPDIIAALI